MDTGAPVYVSGLIPRDVYSDNGAVVLMEKGTRGLGEYRSGMRQGQRRLFVLWTRAVTPAGVAISLASPAADALGRAGFGGDIDTHFWDRFGGALLLSVVDDGVYAVAGNNNQYGTARLPSDAAGIALQGSINIPPTLTKPQGSEVSIFVAQDFDLRDLRERRTSLYLCVSPDNLARVAPLYSLLLSQLVDLNTRELPTGERHRIPVLMVMDEFARLGHAAVIARGFSYVAGYGLRLLPVLQSPAQLRAEYGPDLAEEIMANCGVEIAFAPKELKVAQDLSERLGYWTYQGRSRSRPSGLSSGHRSVSESDQRRALMLPQELIQMPGDRLLVLRAGMPPVRGRKVVYWRERAFAKRVLPPPAVAAQPAVASPKPRAAAPTLPKKARTDMDDLTLDLVLPALEAAGLEPLPPEGASEAQVEAWVDRFIDATVRPAAQEIDHAR